MSDSDSVVLSQILDETRNLRGRVINLDKNLNTVETLAKQNDELTKKQKRNFHWLVGLFIAVNILGFGTAGFVINYVRDNRHSQVVSCQNSNESRMAILDGWRFILGYELIDKSKAQAPAETAMAEAILPWFEQVYAPRDCSDLSQRYEIPPPPILPKDSPDASSR